MDLRGKGMLIITAAVFLVSTLYFTTAKTTFGLSSMIPDEEQLGKMCIRQVSADFLFSLRIYDFAKLCGSFIVLTC